MLDTNVIVSALVFGGVPRRVFELIEDGYHDFFYSSAIQKETLRVLQSKFGWDQPTLKRYLPALWGRGSRVVCRRWLSVIREDPADDRILECAVAAQADIIVSGDRHLLRLSNYETIAILTPRQFVEAHKPPAL